MLVDQPALACQLLPGNGHYACHAMNETRGGGSSLGYNFKGAVSWCPLFRGNSVLESAEHSSGPHPATPDYAEHGFCPLSGIEKRRRLFKYYNYGKLLISICNTDSVQGCPLLVIGGSIVKRLDMHVRREYTGSIIKDGRHPHVRGELGSQKMELQRKVACCLIFFLFLGLTK